MSEREGRGKPERPISAESVGTLVWLLDSSLDRRRYAVVNRLRAVRDSDEFGSLPEALREKVRKLIAESEQEWS
jgi:hypothetical protein